MAITTSTSQQPVFSRISNEEKAYYDRFFEYTNDNNVQSYARCGSLTNLVDLAERAYSVVEKINPRLQAGVPAGPQRQWDLDRLSEIKQRLAKAINYKRAYYENHFFGIITKYILKFFGMWNNGDTADIIKAEDFLIQYDSRLPMLKDAQGNYRTRCFFVFTPASWIRGNLDTSRFYNYNPRRPIPAIESFRYDTLDPRDPRVFIS